MPSPARPVVLLFLAMLGGLALATGCSSATKPGPKPAVSVAEPTADPAPEPEPTPEPEPAPVVQADELA